MSVTVEAKSRKFQASLLIMLIVAFIAVYNRKYLSNEIRPDEELVLFNQYKSRSAIAWNAAQVDSGIALVNNGDIIARTGNDEISDIFRRLNTHEAVYSHIGIVFFENGYPFVYNITAGKENPEGTIRRDSLATFIGPEKNLGFGIYRLSLNKNQKEQLKQSAVRYLKENRKFDLSFDLHTDSLLYCTEFIYKLVTDITKKKDYFTLTHNEEMNFDYVTVDNILLQPKNKMICKVRYKQ